MSRAANTIPTTFTIRKQFEDLALVTLFAASGELWMTGHVSGEFEIAVSQIDGDWHFSDLWILADNLRMGPEARGGLIHLDADADERLYLAILDALENKFTTYIEEWIEEEFAEESLYGRQREESHHVHF
jgi:hypothetical protein